MWITLLIRLVPYLLGAIFIGVLWWRADHWCNSACKEQTEIVVKVQGRLTELSGRLAAAQERATALALLWAEAIKKVEVRYVEAKNRQVVAFAGVRERAGRIRVDLDRVRIRVPAVALGVLDDAARAANASPSGPAGVDSGGPAPVPDAPGREDADTSLTEWVDFAGKAGEAYADVNAKRQAAVDAALACHAYIGQIAQKETP
jgi:hypothetical protein